MCFFLLCRMKQELINQLVRSEKDVSAINKRYEEKISALERVRTAPPSSPYLHQAPVSLAPSSPIQSVYIE